MTKAQKSRLRCRFSMTFNPVLRVVALVDHDDGVSITNDADNVIQWLHEGCLVRDDEHVIYRDTSGYWDELLHKDGKFAGFRFLREHTLTDAAIKAVGGEASLMEATGEWK